MPDGTSSRSLRVAILSTCALPTPPRAYGGTELVLAELARELHDLGHRPTVFATGDSTCTGARRSLFDEAVWPPDPLAELRHAAAAWREIALGDFDVVHVNTPEALAFTRFVDVPTSATIHHVRVEAYTRHYAAYPEVAFAAISRRQAELAWEVPFRSVVHHGLDVERYPLGLGGEACAFLGRLAACKGPHLAIDAARRARVPVVLAGDAHEDERTYFREVLAPAFGRDAVWLGELDQAHKIELLQSARCTLFPIQWEEPFGLVMIESMLVGTPVIAFACGSAPEVIDEGVTGFLVHTVEEMTERIPAIARLDRRTCRAAARERWSAKRMARGYVDLYESAIARFAATHARRPQGEHHVAALRSAGR